jgi:hypothetical protein
LGTDGTFCLSVQMASGQWYSDPCSMEKPYICEVLELSTTSCPTCQSKNIGLALALDLGLVLAFILQGILGNAFFLYD